MTRKSKTLIFAKMFRLTTLEFSDLQVTESKFILHFKTFEKKRQPITSYHQHHQQGIKTDCYCFQHLSSSGELFLFGIKAFTNGCVTQYMNVKRRERGSRNLMTPPIGKIIQGQQEMNTIQISSTGEKILPGENQVTWRKFCSRNILSNTLQLSYGLAQDRTGVPPTEAEK